MPRGGSEGSSECECFRHVSVNAGKTKPTVLLPQVSFSSRDHLKLRYFLPDRGQAERGARSKRSRFITLFHAAMKSCTNFSLPSVAA